MLQQIAKSYGTYNLECCPFSLQLSLATFSLQNPCPQTASLAPKENRAIPPSPLMKTQPLVGSFEYLRLFLAKSPSSQPVCNRNVDLGTAIEDSLTS